MTNEQAIFRDVLAADPATRSACSRGRPAPKKPCCRRRRRRRRALPATPTTGLWGASRVIAIDSNKFRLDKALEFGATDSVEAGDSTVADVMALTGGAGVDVSIEAVGYPSTPPTAASLVRPGGTIANIGVHGAPVPPAHAGHVDPER